MRLTPNKPDERPNEWTDDTCHILGGGHLGEEVAERLRSDGRTVNLVDDTRESDEVPTHRGDPTDVRTLHEVGISSDSTVVVATRSDSRSLLAAQLATVHFDPDRVVVLANAPDCLELLAEAGHKPVCATTALSDALVEQL